MATKIDFSDPVALSAHIDQVNDRLATMDTVDSHVAEFASKLIRELLLLPEDEPDRSEGYLREALREGGALLEEGLYDSREKLRRRKLRQGFEEIRQALVELVEADNVRPSLSAGELARWILNVTEASQKQISNLLDVDMRTLQRWLAHPETKPRNDRDELKLRVAARCINHLRTSLSRPGLILWFDRPHPEFKRKTPARVLQSVPSNPELEPALVRAAAQMRSSGGT